MLSLMMTLCLLSDPSKCEQRELVFSNDSVTQIQCTMGIAGQHEMAEFIKAHPNKFIARWSCRPAGQFAKA
jgi:hypothetical protein